MLCVISVQMLSMKEGAKVPVWKAKEHSWQEMDVLQGSTGMDVELLHRT